MRRVFSIPEPDAERSEKKKHGGLARLLVPDERVTVPEPWCSTPDKILRREPVRSDEWCSLPLTPKKRRSSN